MSNPITTRPRILLVVRIIVLHNKKILLIQRSSGDTSGALQWEVPGGKLDKGQDLMNAAERELIEEVGLYARPIKQLVFFDSDIGKNTKYKNIPYIRLAALYTSDTNKVRISHEHDGYKWVSFENALKLDLTEFTRKSLLAWEYDIKKSLKEI